MRRRGEPSVELRVKMADSEVRLFTALPVDVATACRASRGTPRKLAGGYKRPRKSAESLLLALIARRAARVRARSSKRSSDPATEIAAAA
jgi:hypothetical protein